jgi:hypothetical protein
MRLRMNDRRKHRLENLLDATDENAKAKAIDRAAEFYIKMAGDTTASPVGAIEELMERADEQGSVTAEEIAQVLDTEELPVDAETSWSVGPE